MALVVLPLRGHAQMFAPRLLVSSHVDWVSSALPVVTCASLRHPVAYDAARLCGTGARAVAAAEEGEGDLRSVLLMSRTSEKVAGKVWPLERLRLCTKQIGLLIFARSLPLFS